MVSVHIYLCQDIPQIKCVSLHFIFVPYPRLSLFACLPLSFCLVFIYEHKSRSHIYLILFLYPSSICFSLLDNLSYNSSSKEGCGVWGQACSGSAFFWSLGWWQHRETIDTSTGPHSLPMQECVISEQLGHTENRENSSHLRCEKLWLNDLFWRKPIRGWLCHISLWVLGATCLHCATSFDLQFEGSSNQMCQIDKHHYYHLWREQDSYMHKWWRNVLGALSHAGVSETSESLQTRRHVWLQQSTMQFKQDECL